MSVSPKRAYMRAMLQEATAVATKSSGLEGLRCPELEDVERLGVLLHRAYQGTVDYEGESVDDSIAEVRKTVAGEYGSFDPQNSSVAERAGRLVGATLVTRYQDRPFVAFTVTDPDFARQGIARATLERSMHLLQGEGQTELGLMVTVDNEPARRLYESLSFRVEG